MKPSATHNAIQKWLLASVLAVVWAILTTVSWTLLALFLGRSRGNLRLIMMLVIGAVVAASVCAHAYREGSESRETDDNRPTTAAGAATKEPKAR